MAKANTAKSQSDEKPGIIRNYGLFWNPLYVNWEVAPQNGKLLGLPENKKEVSLLILVNRWEFTCSILTMILFTWAKLDLLEKALFSRLKNHCDRQSHLFERWDKFSWFGFRRIIRGEKLAKISRITSSSRTMSLNHMEAVLITATEPGLNKQGGAFGKKVKRIIQFPDEEKLKNSESQMIKDIWEGVDSEE